MTPVIDERLQKISGLSLSSGAHAASSEEMCVMEAVAYVAGEKWSDHPECACPIISSFLRAWNDGLPTDADRDRLLKALVPRLVGTKRNAAMEHRRSLMAADWLVRVNTPAWLRLAGLTAQADVLAALPEITDMAQVPSMRGPIEAARRDAAAAGDAAWVAAGDAARVAAGDAAWAAAGVAAGVAAGDAAGDAAWVAAGDAAWDAAGDAAGDAARVAAWDAAGDAAWDAAGDAIQKKFAPTVEHLQQSALQLVIRMIELGETK